MATLFTNHSQERARQRGFSNELVSLLLQYGDISQVKGGAQSYRMTNEAIKSSLSDLKNNSTFKKYRDVLSKKILILSDTGMIITLYNLRS